jgi:hypothetical protein
MKEIKLIDKLTFTVTLVAMVFFFFYLGHDPTETFIYFYTVLVCSIFIYRILVWPKQGYHLYLMEFCYFANILSLIMIYFYPEDKNVWYMVYTSDSGVIALAAIIFGNRFAFSSID